MDFRKMVLAGVQGEASGPADLDSYSHSACPSLSDFSRPPFSLLQYGGTIAPGSRGGYDMSDHEPGCMDPVVQTMSSCPLLHLSILMPSWEAQAPTHSQWLPPKVLCPA